MSRYRSSSEYGEAPSDSEIGVSFEDLDAEQVDALDALVRRILESPTCVPLDDLPANASDADIARVVTRVPLPRRIALAARGNLRERELTRHGERILAGGDMYEQHKAFMDWASRYDSAGPEMRSLETHRRWARQLQCQVLELKGPEPVEAWLGDVLAALD